MLNALNVMRLKKKENMNKYKVYIVCGLFLSFIACGFTENTQYYFLSRSILGFSVGACLALVLVDKKSNEIKEK